MFDKADSGRCASGTHKRVRNPQFFKFSESILMPLHRGAPRAPKVRWALRWLERKSLMAEILRGVQLMHLYLMLDAFNPILAMAVLEAKDLPPFVMFCAISSPASAN